MAHPQIVVVGASGFGRETLDVLDAMTRACSDHALLGVIDDQPSAINLQRLADRGLAHLGSLDAFLAATVVPVDFLVGIGDPAVRSRVAQRLEAAGHRPFTAVHPTAIIGSRVRVGAGSVICAGAVVSTNVTLGRHVHLNPACVIGHDTSLADYVSINPAATVSGEVSVERDTLIGAGAIILQNLAVGASTIVGAGAVVTKDVPAGVVVTGIPGRWAKRGNA